MDNIEQLNSLLAPILNDPTAMAGIAEAASQLGLGDLLGSSSSSSGSAAPPHTSENQAQNGISTEAVGKAKTDSSDNLLDMLGKVMPLLSGSDSKPQDDSARLLAALRPFVHGDRAKRLDDAERMLKLLHVITLLKNQGIL